MTPSQKQAVANARDRLKDQLNSLGSYAVYTCDGGMSDLTAAIDQLVPNESDPVPPEVPVDPVPPTEG
jgi:hypothetical protein